MIIVGAGLAGLIAAHRFPAAQVLEAGERKEGHKALLRFRSDAISRLTGVPFNKVNVHKGIFVDGKFVRPTISLANAYCRKVLGSVNGDRSIWNVDTTVRYIAPSNFFDILSDKVSDRVAYNSPYEFSKGDSPVISTAPLPVALNITKKKHDLAFESKPITTVRIKLEGVKNVYQTIYFPTAEHDVYRASITDDTMILESISDKTVQLSLIALAFGLSQYQFDTPIIHHQRLGKIAAVNDDKRKALLHDLTDSHNIFSLGRFATWRNILLDDLIQDMDLIEKLIKTETYRRKLLR